MLLKPNGCTAAFHREPSRCKGENGQAGCKILTWAPKFTATNKYNTRLKGIKPNSSTVGLLTSPLFHASLSSVHTRGWNFSSKYFSHESVNIFQERRMLASWREESGRRTGTALGKALPTWSSDTHSTSHWPPGHSWPLLARSPIHISWTLSTSNLGRSWTLLFCQLDSH